MRGWAGIDKRSNHAPRAPSVLARFYAPRIVDTRFALSAARVISLARPARTRILGCASRTLEGRELTHGPRMARSCLSERERWDERRMEEMEAIF